jgi:hypothetical protein
MVCRNSPATGNPAAWRAQTSGNRQGTRENKRAGQKPGIFDPDASRRLSSVKTSITLTLTSNIPQEDHP